MSSVLLLREYEAFFLDRSNADKQALGQTIVTAFGGRPGPNSSDGGIDGWFCGENDRRIAVQVKLQSGRVGRPQMQAFKTAALDLKAKHGVFISVYGFSRPTRQLINSLLHDKTRAFQCVDITISQILMNQHLDALRLVGVVDVDRVGTLVGRAFETAE
jgi:predicted helicase